MGSYCVMFHSGFNEKKDVITAAEEAGLVVKAGASIRYIDAETGEILYKAQGMSNFINDMPVQVYNDIASKSEEQNV